MSFKYITKFTYISYHYKAPHNICSQQPLYSFHIYRVFILYINHPYMLLYDVWEITHDNITTHTCVLYDVPRNNAHNISLHIHISKIDLSLVYSILYHYKYIEYLWCNTQNYCHYGYYNTFTTIVVDHMMTFFLLASYESPSI